MSLQQYLLALHSQLEEYMDYQKAGDHPLTIILETGNRQIMTILFVVLSIVIQTIITGIEIRTNKGVLLTEDHLPTGGIVNI